MSVLNILVLQKFWAWVIIRDYDGIFLFVEGPYSIPGDCYACGIS
jgi:hypothetical protein